MAGEQGGSGYQQFAEVYAAAQTATAVIAAPGANYAIRIYRAEIHPATGDAHLHHDNYANTDKKFVAGQAGARGAWEPTPQQPFYQLPDNEALNITSDGAVVVNVEYETVYTDTKPLGGPHA